MSELNSCGDRGKIGRGHLGERIEGVRAGAPGESYPQMSATPRRREGAVVVVVDDDDDPQAASSPPTPRAAAPAPTAPRKSRRVSSRPVVL